MMGTILAIRPAIVQGIRGQQQGSRGMEPVLHSLAISQVMLNYAAQRGVDPSVCLAGTDITRLAR